MKERLRPTGVVNTGNNVSGNKGLRLGKFAIRKGALGYPGLIATGAYLGGKKLVKTIAGRQRGLQWAPYRQYNKKGRKIV